MTCCKKSKEKGGHCHYVSSFKGENPTDWKCKYCGRKRPQSAISHKLNFPYRSLKSPTDYIGESGWKR